MVHPGFDSPFRDTQPFGHFADLDCGIIDEPHHLAFVFGQFVNETVKQLQQGEGGLAEVLEGILKAPSGTGDEGSQEGGDATPDVKNLLKGLFGN